MVTRDGPVKSAETVADVGGIFEQDQGSRHHITLVIKHSIPCGIGGKPKVWNLCAVYAGLYNATKLSHDRLAANIAVRSS